MNDVPWWERDVWEGSLVPWATPALTLRLDQISRRRQSLEAILAWPAASQLWHDAWEEIRRTDEAFDAWWADCQVRIAAWCSWPTEVSA